MSKLLGIASLAVVTLLCAHAAADTALPTADAVLYGQAVFGFGGFMVDDDMGTSANLFGANYEDNFLLGAGYQRFVYSGSFGLHYGLEAGAAGRFGESSSAEFWGGVVVRHEGIQVASAVHIAPALTVGLSAITDTIGREARNETVDAGDATLLFYLGPELNFSLPRASETELFWRLHHRSGAGGTLGDMRGAANANVIGLRSRF